MLNRVSVKRHRHRAARKVVNAYDVIARQAFKLRSEYADWLDEGPRGKRQSEQDAGDDELPQHVRTSDAQRDVELRLQAQLATRPLELKLHIVLIPP